MTDSLVTPEAAEREPIHVGFLLVNNFTLLALSSAMEPLRMANQLAGKKLYTWNMIGGDGEPIRTSGGMQVIPDYTLDDPIDYDIVFVVSGINVMDNYDARHVRWLKAAIESLDFCSSSFKSTKYLDASIIASVTTGSITDPPRRVSVLRRE